MKKIFSTLALVVVCVIGMAQNSVKYDVEPAIMTIQNDYIKVWNRLGETDGFRIQIAAITGTNSRTTAENERFAFQSRFPEIPAYISYMEPYFRIRVGNFNTRLEAYYIIKEIESEYPNAYIVPEKITYSE